MKQKYVKNFLNIFLIILLGSCKVSLSGNEAVNEDANLKEDKDEDESNPGDSENRPSTEEHLLCSNSEGDGGYSVTFSVDQRSAQVEKNNIAGAQIVANLKCLKEVVAPCCDQISTRVCVDGSVKNPNRAVYSAVLESGGISGRTVLSLQEDDMVSVIPCEMIK